MFRKEVVGIIAIGVSVLSILFLIWEPKELWIACCGREKEKALKEYQEMVSESKEDSLSQVAMAWKDKKEVFEDSLARAEVRKRELDQACIKKEISLSKSDPCESSLVFYSAGSLYNIPTMPSAFKNPRLDWLVGSTKCDSSTKIRIKVYENGIFPFVLRDKEWIRWQFGTRGLRAITAQELNRFFNLCGETAELKVGENK